MKLALKAALVALGVFAAGAAQAANAISTTNLNIRTGPARAMRRWVPYPVERL